LVNEGGGQTIDEVRNAERHALEDHVKQHPLMQAVLLQFPKAKIGDIRTAQQIAEAATQEALPEVDEEWDPFEEE
jgi:DNA polymerase-3 subunit gamma/tau